MTNPTDHPDNPDDGQREPSAPNFGQHPGQTPIPPQPKKSKKKLWLGLGGGCCGLIILLVIIVIVGGALSGGSATDGPDSDSGASETQDAGTDETTDRDSEAEQPSEEAAAEEPAEDSSIKVTISEVERTTEIGDQYLESQAQGEYVVVRYTFTNDSGEAVDLASSEFRLIGADGTEYSETSDGFTAFPDDYAIYETVNTGNSFEGVVVFDVPEGTEVTTLQYQPTFSFDGPIETEIP